MTKVSNEFKVFNEVENPADLVVEHAEKLAASLTTKSTNEPTKSQMRRFYQEYLKLRQRIKSGGEDAYKKNEVALKMLISKAKYATGRQNVKVPEEFVKWFEENIKAINSAKDVETFGQYFEAFMGYFYDKQSQSNNQRGGR